MSYKKTFFLGVLLLTPSLLLAGEVKTKDKPKECGGYHDGEYHLKCENEKKAREGYIERDQNIKNPFKGFGEQGSKPKKQGSMPHG